MAMMEWNEALNVGHSKIDRDHKKLVGLINALGDAMSTGQGTDVCGDVLDDLISYTKTHFAMEETGARFSTPASNFRQQLGNRLYPHPIRFPMVVHLEAEIPYITGEQPRRLG